MANQEHGNILKRGVEAWNTWRSENISIIPDLSGADFQRANLTEANLEGTQVRSARSQQQG
jgi:uncharacterized protein YjbI with pentapeptide repeats